MKGWVIYDKSRYKRNHYYVDLYKLHFEKSGIDFKLILVEDLSVSNGEWRYKKEVVHLPDFAIMRTYSLGLSKVLESYGVRVFNNSRVAEIGNDKYKTYLFAQKYDIPVMDTYYVDKHTPKYDIAYPYIVKSLNGHGGNEVFLINKNEDYSIACEKILHKPHIVQKLSNCIGKDLRVYILGGKIFIGMLRESANGDFKSNYSLGGKAKRVKIDDNVKQIVDKVVANLPCDFVGIDFIYNDGLPVLNEIEDIVGSRMLYNLGIDVVALYINYIINELKGKP